MSPFGHNQTIGQMSSATVMFKIVNEGKEVNVSNLTKPIILELHTAAPSWMNRTERNDTNGPLIRYLYVYIYIRVVSLP